MITELRDGDEAEWLRLRRALWPDCSEEMHALEMRERIRMNGEVFVLRRDRGGLGGFVEVSIRERVDGATSDRVGYIEGWFVDEDLRGHGAGRQLIDRACAWAKAQGLTEIASDAEIENRHSIQAHRALGFRETFRLVHFLKPLG